MHLQFISFIIIAAFISFTKAFVKIDVPKITSTTIASPVETTVVAAATTSIPAPPNVTYQPIPEATTLIPTTSIVTPTNVTTVTTNTTSKPELNQTEVNVTRPMLDDHLPRTSRIKISPDHYYCPCDLMVNLCDINCCCDNDCSNDMLSVFVCDEKHWSIYDFEFDVGLSSCDIKDELLCVVGKDVVTSKAQFDITLLNERDKYKWPKMFTTDWSNDESRESYKSGDSVLAFDDKTEEIGMFGECSSIGPIANIWFEYQTYFLRRNNL